jgi:hypothetical protein
MFGHRHFPTCVVHADEAAAVPSLAEALSGQRLDDLDLEASVAEASGAAGAAALRGLRMGEVAAIVAAIEKEFAAGREHVQRGSAEWPAEVLGRVLLGDASAHSSWDPGTVWSRSIRSLVNERARFRAGCACGNEEGRP